MARRRSVNDLPPLGEVFSAFHGFPPKQSRQQALIRLLREAADELKGVEPTLFYSMREVADFFAVPLRTVAIAYEKLDFEGTLLRIRGSKTMLAGRDMLSRQPINAVIGLPICLQSLIASPFECSLQMELEERLRLRGFVADSIFFRTHEECDPEFAERLLRHNLDMVIWHSPHPLASHVLMSLRDRGVRLLLFQSSESPVRIPSRLYSMEWQHAYLRMALEWRERGIRRAIVPTPENLLSLRAFRMLQPLLSQNGIEPVMIEATEQCLADTVLRSGKPGGHDAVAFLDVHVAHALCNGYPELIEAVSERARLAFCRGPVRVPRLITKRIAVDVVEQNPADLAEGVVADLCDPTQKQEGVRRTFQAWYHSQVLMSDGVDL